MYSDFLRYACNTKGHMLKNKKSKACKTEKLPTHSNDNQPSELSLEEQLELFADILIDHVLTELNEQSNP